VLASLLFMRRMAEVSTAGYVTRNDEEDSPARTAAGLDVPDSVKVFEIYGAFFFGAASKFKDAIHEIDRAPKVLVLRLRNVPAIDATAVRALRDVFDKTKREGTRLVLAGVDRQPRRVIERSGLLEIIGPENVFADVAGALARARELGS
jgi:SulP family sulfate permease